LKEEIFSFLKKKEEVQRYIICTMNPSLLILDHSSSSSQRAKTTFCFDLDDTLITTISGKKFPADVDDWEIVPGVIQSLRLLSSDSSAQIVIVTNQAGHRRDPSVIEGKLRNVAAYLSSKRISYRLFAALSRDRNRKPSTGVIEDFVDSAASSSFVVVGDAAGRPADFSDSDAKFAFNIGLITKKPTSFYTPESFFGSRRGSPASLRAAKFSGFDPSSIQLPEPGPDPICSKISQILLSRRRLLVLMCGPPASGKTTASRRISRHCKSAGVVCEVVSLDEIKNRVAKAVSLMRSAFSDSGARVVVIDGTNRSQLSRSNYLMFQNDAFDEHLVVDFKKNYPRDLVEHLNVVRCRENPGVIETPKVAFNSFYKHYEEPKAPERAIFARFAPEFGKTSELYFRQRS
jgi:DNA 3'-phosphatase